MKKIVKPFVALIFWMACLSQTVIAQLSDGEQEERCQNNKNRIAELEPRLRAIKADLAASMTEKDIAEARTHMVFARQDPEKVDVDWVKFERIGRLYNWNYLQCYKANLKVGFNVRRKCFDDLEKIITAKIDKALSLDRPELLAKKKETEQLLAAHRNNLIALGCDNQAKALSGACKLEGSWTQDTPGIGSTTWEIKKDGTASERGIGYANGKASLKANTLHIDWTTSTGYSGYYEWVLDGNCSSGKGTLQFKTGRTDKLNSTVKRN